LETTGQSVERVAELFEELGGEIADGFPNIHSPVSRTKSGTAYLTAPGVVMLAKPQTNLVGLGGFLEGFDPSLGFPAYLEDPTTLPDSSQLCKTAGQACYASFGPRRTTNENAAGYFERLTSAGHGSVLEHASFSFLLYGISRSVTHELVRHRAGVGISQVSQRYVSGAVLRFVERPEYQDDRDLHVLFEERADRAAAEYEAMAGRLLERQERGAALLDAEYKTDARKKVQQTARSLLPNETEAPMVFTGNVRASTRRVRSGVSPSGSSCASLHPTRSSSATTNS
jgi:thymidylate synthase (FAD)